MVRTTLAWLFGATLCWAAIHRIHVEERTEVLEGRPFGAAGPYERITARAFFQVDPESAQNRVIADIDLAPRNESGLVEFAADLYVLKPRDPARGNGTVIFEAANRGRKGLPAMFNRGASGHDPVSEQELGDFFLLEAGYTLVWLGWQFDVPNERGLLRAYLPIALNHGRPITGLVRAQLVADAPVKVWQLSDRDHVPYPAVAGGAHGATLTVRQTCNEEPKSIERTRWRFVDPTHITLEGGFQPGRLYEFVYLARDPVVAGLGLAGVRDLISFLKYGGRPLLLGDQRRFIKRAIAFGTSQSGRFLRQFLYDGFNQDEQGRKVFDGVWAHVAGAGRGSFNHRFAQPSRDGRPWGNCQYPVDLFPHTDAEVVDPVTGEKDGLLKRVTALGVTPKIFYTNGSYEYWGRAASLTHTMPDGSAGVAPAPQTRIYFIAGAQHGPGSFPPVRQNTQYWTNPLDYRWVMRALLAAMNRWLEDGTEPPASRFPAMEQLVAPERVGLPAPGIQAPRYPLIPLRLDFGPDFRTQRRITYEPPRPGRPFAVLAPRLDGNGNEVGGIRMPEIEVPLGSYAGWNLRAAQLGAPEHMISFIGSFFPLARTKRERQKRGDGRLSIEERYSSKGAYLESYEQKARQLAAEGYLLSRDRDNLLRHASALWDWVMQGEAGTKGRGRIQ